MARFILLLFICSFSVISFAGDVHVLYIGGNFRWQARPSSLFIKSIVKDFKVDSSNVTLMINKEFDRRLLEDYKSYNSTIHDLKHVSDSLQMVLDGDDLLIVYIFTHAYGYVSYKTPREYENGRCRSSFVDIEKGKELEYTENELKIRALYERSETSKTAGLGEWVYVYDLVDYKQMKVKWHRYKYISGTKQIRLSNKQNFKDKDVYIEKLVDYLEADENKDGYMDKQEMARNNITRSMRNSLTEEDWGLPDSVIDNIKDWERPEFAKNSTIYLADVDKDHKLEAVYANDFTLINQKKSYKIIGKDLDNDGVFDKFDCNFDGDYTDSIGINEFLRLGDGSMLVDDSLAAIFEDFSEPRLMFFFNSCFSKGFVNDLAGENRAVLAASQEDEYAYSSYFSDLFWGAMRNQTVSSDLNSDSRIGITEAFWEMKQKMKCSTPSINVNGRDVSEINDKYLDINYNWQIK